LIGSLCSVLDGNVLGGSGNFSIFCSIMGSSTSLVIGDETAVVVCNSCLLLQNEVVQRHADPCIPASGSDTSLKLQSAVGLNGLSMGPRTTDFGKHSLRTAVSVIDFFQV